MATNTTKVNYLWWVVATVATEVYDNSVEVRCIGVKWCRSMGPPITLSSLQMLQSLSVLQDGTAGSEGLTFPHRIFIVMCQKFSELTSTVVFLPSYPLFHCCFPYSLIFNFRNVIAGGKKDWHWFTIKQQFNVVILRIFLLEIACIYDNILN